MLILIKILTWLASPLGLFFFLVLAGLILRRWRLRLIGFACLLLWALASFPVADLLTRPLEDQARALEEKTKAEFALQGIKPVAIVVLGGGMNVALPPLRPHADMGEAADRVWHAARLFKSGAAPHILVSGGKVPGLEHLKLQTEAEAMRDLLLEFGVPAQAILMESESRTTRENASRTRILFERRGLVRSAAPKSSIPSTAIPILLVTSATHLPRSLSNYTAEGFLVGARPTDFRGLSEDRPLWRAILPSAQALERTEMVIKEWIANLIRY